MTSAMKPRTGQGHDLPPGDKVEVPECGNFVSFVVEIDVTENLRFVAARQPSKGDRFALQSRNGPTGKVDAAGAFGRPPVAADQDAATAFVQSIHDNAGGLEMRVFRTANLEPERRAASWTAFYSTRFAPVNFRPIDNEDFQAELVLGAVQPLDLAQMRSNGYRAERTMAHIAATPARKFGFIVLIDGTGVVKHCAREAELGPGDILVNDNTEPITCRFKGPFNAITVRASEDVVRSRLSRIDDLCGLRLPAATGLTRAVSIMAKCLLDHTDASIRADHSAAMAGHVLDVLATCYAMAWQRPASEQSASGFRYSMARQFIERNLSAPDLSAEKVAEALRISSRYLRIVMREAGESVSALILRRRLEEAAKQLANPLCQDRKISDIASSWGFKSGAHFARTFKAHYNMTPREHRNRAQTDRSLRNYATSFTAAEAKASRPARIGASTPASGSGPIDHTPNATAEAV